MNTGKTDNPGSREDEFADLLKGAGRGPRLSEQARERIRGDVEAHWRAVMDQRSQPQAPGAVRAQAPARPLAPRRALRARAR